MPIWNNASTAKKNMYTNDCKTMKSYFCNDMANFYRSAGYIITKAVPPLPHQDDDPSQIKCIFTIKKPLGSVVTPQQPTTTHI